MGQYADLFAPDGDRERANVNLRFSTEAPPDAAAKRTALAQRYGVPESVIEQYQPDYEGRARVEDAAPILERSPRLRAWLAADAANARSAHDDVRGLSLVETALNSVARGVPQMLNSFSMTALNSNAHYLESLDRLEKALAGGRAPESFKAEEDPLGLALMSPAQRTGLREQLGGLIKRQAGDVAMRNDIAAGIPRRQVVDDVFSAGKAEGLVGWERFPAVWKAFKQDPIGFIASIGPESLVANAPGLLAAIPAGIAAGPGGAAAVLGGSSFSTDYASSIQEALSSAGVNIADRDALLAATQNADLMRDVGRQAFAHAMVVGSVDGASAGLASKIALPGKALAGHPLARGVANLMVQAPLQGTLGAAGEFGGQVAAGQEIDPANILAEFVGEFAGTPAEVLTMVMGRLKDGTAATSPTAARPTANSGASDMPRFHRPDGTYIFDDYGPVGRAIGSLVERLPDPQASARRQQFDDAMKYVSRQVPARWLLKELQTNDALRERLSEPLGKGSYDVTLNSQQTKNEVQNHGREGLEHLYGAIRDPQEKPVLIIDDLRTWIKDNPDAKISSYIDSREGMFSDKQLLAAIPAAGGCVTLARV